MIEAFRRRGIYPDNVISLAEESLKWEPADPGLPPIPTEHFGDVSTLAGMTFRQTRKRGESARQFSYESQEEVERADSEIPEPYKRSGSNVFSSLRRLCPNACSRSRAPPPATSIPGVQGAQSVFRVGPGRSAPDRDRFAVRQEDDTSKDDFGGVHSVVARPSSRQPMAGHAIPSRTLLSTHLASSHARGDATARAAASHSSLRVTWPIPTSRSASGATATTRTAISKNMSFAAITGGSLTTRRGNGGTGVARRKSATRRRRQTPASRIAMRPAARHNGGTRGAGTREVTVRMYNVGFGDCFLLRIPTPDGERKVLIDCGTHPGGAGPRKMRQVVQDIVADVTDADGVPRIDLVIGTHRHRDHVSGFDDAGMGRRRSDGNVDLPWPENRRIRKARG